MNAYQKNSQIEKLMKEVELLESIKTPIYSVGDKVPPEEGSSYFSIEIDKSTNNTNYHIACISVVEAGTVEETKQVAQDICDFLNGKYHVHD